MHHTDSEAQRRKMLETPIPALVGRLAVPTIASMLVTSIYNMADTYFVSHISTSASGAVGIVFSIMALIQAVGFTVGVGSSSIASRLLGQGRQEEADAYASSAVLMALILGLLLSIPGLLQLERFIWLLGSTETIFPYAKQYAFFILMGAPIMTLAFTLNNLLRWQGRANLAVVGLTTGGILNILLDPLFIFQFKWGIAGAGAATLLSQTVSMVILLSFFLLKKSDLHLGVRHISHSPSLYFSIFKQGMPSLFRQSIMGFSTMATNYSARLYGDAAVAALAIVNKVFMLVQSVTIGFGQGFQPVLGYNYGAGRTDRVKEAVFFSLKACTAFLVAASVIGFILTPHIISMFRPDDQDVIDIGIRAFRYQCLTLPLAATTTFSNMLFQALGKFWRATFLAVCRQGIYIPLVILLVQTLGLPGLEMSQALADLLTFVLCSIITFLFFKRELGHEKKPTIE